MSEEKRILIISEAHLIKTFVEATITKLKEETGTRFDCFITTPIDEKSRDALQGLFENVYVNDFPKGIMKKVPKLRVLQAIYGLRSVARTLPDYDIAHVHFHHYYFSTFLNIIRKKSRKMYLTFFGGDFDDVSNFKHWFNEKSVDMLDSVFAINDVMLNKISKRYRLPQKRKDTGILRLLMSNFLSFESFLNANSNESAKRMLGIDKPVITCAYSAGIVMQHARIIDALSLVPEKIKEYKIIFPMTYGFKGEETRALVREKLKVAEFDSMLLDKFLPVEKLQALRLVTDVFINVPSRDQAAASMMEHLAAGSVVISGKWLPYDSFLEMGIYMVTVNSMEELPSVLVEVLEHLDEHRMKSHVNRQKVLELMSWDSIRPAWYKYYELK